MAQPKLRLLPTISSTPELLVPIRVPGPAVGFSPCSWAYLDRQPHYPDLAPQKAYRKLLIALPSLSKTPRVGGRQPTSRKLGSERAGTSISLQHLDRQASRLEPSTKISLSGTSTMWRRQMRKSASDMHPPQNTRKRWQLATLIR